MIETRLSEVPSLSQGAHVEGDEMCVMEAVAFVAGESWTDEPVCVSPVIAAFCRTWNDGLPTDGDRDRLLKPLIPRLVNSSSSTEVETRRAWLATDWLVRRCAPAWLDCVPALAEYAARLRALPHLSAATVEDAQPEINAAGEAAWAAARDAARAAAGEAAWAAAGAAAWDAARAAAGDAAGAAAGDAARAAAGEAAWAAAGAAAGEAAWAAARDAARAAAGEAAWAAAGAAAGEAAWDAARDAARAAAWAAAGAAAWDAAGEALQQTTATLQRSALDLVDRMLAETASATPAPEDEWHERP